MFVRQNFRKENKKMESIANHIGNWLLHPETIGMIITFVISLPSIIKNIQIAKGDNLFEKIIEYATNESRKVLFQDLSKEEKRSEVINRIYENFPDTKKYLKEEDVIRAVDIAYNTYVKPNFKNVVDRKKEKKNG
jgi:hypothetical protein